MPSFEDPLPALVRRVAGGEEDRGALLREVLRHVATVARAYPDAWFSLGRKHPEAVDDLGHRVYATCARVPKGRHPFAGRTPFATYVAEQMTGQSIRYHSFYAKLSITREILRADYAHNLASDPRLVWRADLYGEIGDRLRAVARPLPGKPTRWALPGLSITLDEAVLVERLGKMAVAELVVEALRMGGPRTQAGLCRVIEAVVGTPAGPSPTEDAVDDDVPARAEVRVAVQAAWDALGDDERALLAAIARGQSYDEVCVAMPRFAHKVAVNRALERVVAVFRERIAPGSTDAAPPRQILERVIDVLDVMGVL